MNKDKAETIAYAIRKECQRSSLYDWCESWDITIDEFEEFLSNGIKESESEWLKTKSQNIVRKSSHPLLNPAQNQNTNTNTKKSY